MANRTCRRATEHDSVTRNEVRALRLLADAEPRGVTEALMLAHGFPPDMLAGFVRNGLATATTERVTAGGHRIDVTQYRITKTGQALVDLM
jgi:hypothetical protein